ncbi:glycerate kinase type-2 family protein [Paratissierella segnis]|uniref:DUF4147 domain-containing protein n=1 Tax=Paratissierella segnis TaxID=2763679 RepID=A0A926ILH7_9FIRM|nr:DUF4147 domain-containing protein [Paratissierella segnis]MBC8588673.1 DUF4147 domain-containing protein [Paratissierella segnis]
MKYIKNADILLKHGDVPAKGKILELLDRLWYEMDSYRIIKNMVKIEDGTLHIGECSWDLCKKKNIYLFGAGKACNAMAMAMDEVLGEHLSKGIISVKIAEPEDKYKNTIAYVGGHPLPNKEGMTAALEIIKMIDDACSDDLFISVISGGSSALLTCSVDGITLEDEICTQDTLLRSGAKIGEINAVRRHISLTNGGRLAERILGKGAELINIIVDDGIGELPLVNRNVPVPYSATPVAEDSTTLQDARDCIENYNLKNRIPKSVIEYLWDDDPKKETPKAFNSGITHFVLNSVPDSCEEALKIAKDMGINAMVFSTFLEGEAREAGYFFGSLAREIQANKRPIVPPCFVFCSGEATTTVLDGCTGKGGPGHELALGFALEVKDIDNVALASVDTEGTDGTTVFAGGIVDTHTIRQIEDKGYDYYEIMRNHDSGGALEAIDSSILTGNTGTNVCDFNVMYIGK